MHLPFTLRKRFVFSFLIILIVAGCTRITSTDLGSGLIPPIDGVITKDTLLDVITDNFDDPDTARVYRSDMHVLGAITNDPLFGKTKAAMYFEMQPDSYPFYIPGTKDSVVVDSAVLILHYDGVYGDSTQPLHINVYGIDPATPIDLTRNYPANYPDLHPIRTLGPLAAPVTVDIRRLGDSVKNRFEQTTNQLRIRLNNDVARRFMKVYDSSNVYKSDSLLRTVFAGFAVTADAVSPANALLRINLVDTSTKLALYYNSSSTGATQRDTSVRYFRCHSSSGSVNYITRDRSGSEVANHLNTTSKPDSLVYLQTGPGTYVRVRIPGLKTLSNRIIHRAELIAEQVPDAANAMLETQLLPPRFLLLSVFDSANNYKRNVPNDFIVGSSGANISSFGGGLLYKTVPGYDRLGTYVFDLSRYVQGIVTRQDTLQTLRLTAPVNDSLHYHNPYPANTGTGSLYYLTPSSIGNTIGYGRVRLGGGTHSRFRMRLRIIYSRI